VYGGASAVYTMTNTYTQSAWVLNLQGRGFGIFQDTNVSLVIEDSTSETTYGQYPLTLEQQLQQDTALGLMFGRAIIDYDRNPHIKLESLTAIANRTQDLMESFLNLDIGDMVGVTETGSGVSGYHYIQGENFTAVPTSNGTAEIEYTWLTRQQLSLAAGTLSPIGVNVHDNAPDAINYGVVPQLNSLTLTTFSFWIKPSSLHTKNSGWVLANYDSINGFYIAFDFTLHTISFTNQYFSGQLGKWYPTSATIANDTLAHVVITCDMTSTNAPIIYYNGSPVATTINSIPIGVYTPAGSATFVIANAFNSLSNFTNPMYGLLEDIRIYNCIRTQSDVTTLYNGGTPSATVGPLDHLVFQGPVVRTPELASYTGHTLTTSLTVLDNIYGVVGQINGSPTGAAF
jgi:hypothetical protein